jgi:hypothetical protein
MLLMGCSKASAAIAATFPTSNLVLRLDASNLDSRDEETDANPYLDSLVGSYKYQMVNGAMFGSQGGVGVVSFDGVNDWMGDDTGDAYTEAGLLTLNTGNDFSISAWFYAASLANTLELWSSHETSADNFRLFVDSNGAIKLGLNLNNTTYNTENSAVTAGAWNNVTLTKAGSNTYKVFVNKAEKSLAGGSHDASANADLVIGNDTQNAGITIAFKLAEFYAYTSSLSSSDVDAIFDTTKSKYGL